MQEARNKPNPFAFRRETNQQTTNWNMGGVHHKPAWRGDANTAPLCPDAPTRAQGVASELHKSNPERSHPAGPQGLALELHETKPRRLVLTGPLPPPPAKESLPSYTKIAKKGSVPAGPQGLGLELHKTKPKRLVLTVPSPPPTPSSKGAASKLHKNSQKWSVPAGPQGFRSE